MVILATDRKASLYTVLYLLDVEGPSNYMP